MTTRRQFLSTALAGTATASLASALPLTALGREKETPLTATALADNLFVITGAGANVVAARGADGAVLIDGGLERRSSGLLRLATKHTGTKRVAALLNTHWHPEQTGSNPRL